MKILPSDKGNSIVILTHKQYHDKVQEHIDEGPYTELSKDPTSTLPSKLDRILKRLLTDNKITKSFYDSCRNLHPRSPQLYGTPKIHKVNCPIRPIVSFYNTPLIALHKTLAHYLKPLSNSNLRLKDSNDMIQILRSITDTSSHSYFCSLDIKSLYTSCNMKHAQRIVKTKLHDHPSLLPSNISPTAFGTLISFCLDNSYFEYNNKFFAQNSGGPMGSPLTVELAEIRVTELETIALNTSPQPPSLYKHFVDDGFGVFRDKTHAESYLEYVNSLSSDLVYTIEHPSQDGSIPFLDILIHKDLSTSVYRKPTHTDTYTHYSTAAPQTTKDSLIRSLTRRAYNICSPQHLDLELTHVKSVLLDNGYPLNHINFIMHRTKKSLSKPKPPRTKAYNTLANISVPYYPALSKPLRQISDRHNISLTFTSNRNLRNMLTNTKTQPPPHTTRNVIYQIPCKDCNATYCGQTRRPLYLRLSEHQRFTNNSKSFTSTDLQYTSAVAHHAHTTGHTIDFKSTHILSSLTKSSQLDLTEHAAIKIICPSLNKLHSAPNINNQWTDLLPTIKNSFRPRLAYPP